MVLDLEWCRRQGDRHYRSVVGDPAVDDDPTIIAATTWINQPDENLSHTH
jgi:hypothetical protein